MHSAAVTVAVWSWAGPWHSRPHPSQCKWDNHEGYPTRERNHLKHPGEEAGGSAHPLSALAKISWEGGHSALQWERLDKSSGRSKLQSHTLNLVRTWVQRQPGKVQSGLEYGPGVNVHIKCSEACVFINAHTRSHACTFTCAQGLCTCAGLGFYQLSLL
jgi:hypothetical protein